MFCLAVALAVMIVGIGLALSKDAIELIDFRYDPNDPPFGSFTVAGPVRPLKLNRDFLGPLIHYRRVSWSEIRQSCGIILFLWKMTRR